MDLIEAATELSSIANRPGATYEDAMDAAHEVLVRAGEEPDRLDDAVRVLLAAVRAEDDDRAGIGAIVCGALVEKGADATLATEHLVERFVEVTKTSARYVALCKDYFENEILSDDAVCAVCGPGEEEDDIMMPQVREVVSASFPQGEDAWIALDLFCRPTVSVLVRDANARRRLAQDVELVNVIGALAAHQPGAYFVWALLSLLDDAPLTVIVPGLDDDPAAGWRVRIDGVADNFQLHLLLADALVGGGIVDGEALEPEVVDVVRGTGPPLLDEHVMGYWNMYNWTALSPQRTLPDGYFNQGSQHMIWNEGVPADIATLDGERLMLLGPAPVIRQWRPARLFEPLAASLQIEHTMSPDEVDAWLRRITERTLTLQGQGQADAT